MAQLQQQQLNGVWVGFAESIGATAIVVGDSLTTGWAASVANPENSFDFRLFSLRFGLGAGASAGTSLVIATGVNHPRELAGVRQSGKDFQLSLEGQWGTLVKSLPKLKTLAGLAKTGVRLAKRGIKAGAFLENHDWIRSVLEGLDVDLNAKKPQVTMLGLPAGGGLEVSAYYESGRFEISNVRFQAVRRAA